MPNSLISNTGTIKKGEKNYRVVKEKQNKLFLGIKINSHKVNWNFKMKATFHACVCSTITYFWLLIFTGVLPIHEVKGLLFVFEMFWVEIIQNISKKTKETKRYHENMSFNLKFSKNILRQKTDHSHPPFVCPSLL